MFLEHIIHKKHGNCLNQTHQFSSCIYVCTFIDSVYANVVFVLISMQVYFAVTLCMIDS